MTGCVPVIVVPSTARDPRLGGRRVGAYYRRSELRPMKIVSCTARGTRWRSQDESD
jgi:hypothetical protein